MNYIKYTLALIVLSFSLLSSAQVNKDDIDKAIDINSLQHPYLYFTEEEKPAILNRIENDPESNDIFRRLQAEAKMWLEMPVDRNIPIRGKNTRAGWSKYDRDRKYKHQQGQCLLPGFSLPDDRGTEICR